MNDIIDEYIHNVRENMYHLIQAEHFLDDLRTNLEEYVQQYPDCTYSDLEEQFGLPESVAEEFIENEKPNPPKERAKHRNRIRIGFAAALVAIVVLIGFVIALSGSQILYYTDETEIIEDVEVLSE